ncbi:hypothetical protein ACHAXR_002070 [Thalassiosira sp. AJA248-18]
MVQIDAGNTWEMEWGSVVWMIIYIGSAFGSSVFSTICMPDNISVGSSGAVMGLFGAKFSEIVLLCFEKSTNIAELSGERSRKQQACLVIGGIVIVAAMSFIPYVDWAAHLGGMIAGFVLGLVCFSFKIRSWFFMLLWLVVGVGSTIALYSGAMAYMYTEVETNDELRYVLIVNIVLCKVITSSLLLYLTSFVSSITEMCVDTTSSILMIMNVRYVLFVNIVHTVQGHHFSSLL